MILNILAIVKKLEDFCKLDGIEKEDSAKAIKFRENLKIEGMEEYKHIERFIFKF